jgi:hypothetical protein
VQSSAKLRCRTAFLIVRRKHLGIPRRRSGVGAMQRRARALSTVVVLAALAACSPEEAPPRTSAPSVSGQRPTTQAENVPGHEVRAESATLETWALLYVPPWTAGQTVKVVWRSTGAGGFSALAVGPDDQRVAPVSGPTEHFESNWARPGDEWGTFFRLDEPGVWELRVERCRDTASLPITVIAT